MVVASTRPPRLPHRGKFCPKKNVSNVYNQSLQLYWRNFAHYGWQRWRAVQYTAEMSSVIFFSLEMSSVNIGKDSSFFLNIGKDSSFSFFFFCSRLYPRHAPFYVPGNWECACPTCIVRTVPATLRHVILGHFFCLFRRFFCA